MTNEFQNELFSAPQERVSNISRLVLELVSREKPLRILDIGCGTGALLSQLVQSVPGSTGLGVDVSPSNIAAALATTQDSAVSGRLRFELGDFWSGKHGEFDLIVADSVFHLVPIPRMELFTKVVASMAPGGYLVMTIPFDCFYNQCLWGVRRLFRALRSRFTDALVLSVGMLIHGKGYSRETLQERIVYMYHVPTTFFDRELNAMFIREFGLEPMLEQRLPHASLAQPRHKVVGFRRPPV